MPMFGLPPITGHRWFTLSDVARSADDQRFPTSVGPMGAFVLETNT